MRRTTFIALAAGAATFLVAAPAQATFPGGNGLLVFQRPVHRQVDLYTVRPDGAGLHRLTRTRAWEEKAEWSPDGQRLAFARSRPSGRPTEIATTNASGADLRVLTHFDSASMAPTWSPDGLLAYFTLRDFPKSPPNVVPPAELYSMAQDGSDQRRLTHDRTIQTDPEWSPDGSTIAYSQWYAVPHQPGVFDIGVSLIDRDGNHPRVLLGELARRDVASMSWSPDGKRLVYEITTAQPNGRTRRSRQSDLAIINVDGTGPRRLTRTAALETEPVWSPDGTRIAFASDRHVKHGRHLDRNGPAFEIYTMRADGTNIKRLTHNHVADLYPDWQPQ